MEKVLLEQVEQVQEKVITLIHPHMVAVVVLDLMVLLVEQVKAMLVEQVVFMVEELLVSQKMVMLLVINLVVEQFVLSGQVMQDSFLQQEQQTNKL